MEYLQRTTILEAVDERFPTIFMAVHTYKPASSLLILLNTIIWPSPYVSFMFLFHLKFAAGLDITEQDKFPDSPSFM